MNVYLRHLIRRREDLLGHHQLVMVLHRLVLRLDVVLPLLERVQEPIPI